MALPSSPDAAKPFNGEYEALAHWRSGTPLPGVTRGLTGGGGYLVVMACYLSFSAK
jgi:hypothetical protein